MDRVKDQEPTIAPSIDTHNTLEADATKEEKESGDTTEVTHLYLDRTPEDGEMLEDGNVEISDKKEYIDEP
jgi:hypothetical protein